MANWETVLRLNDMIEAIERIWSVVEGLNLDDFEDNREKRWLVER